MQVRILHTENLRFPGLGSSSWGYSGPKLRPKGVSDGKQAKYSCTTYSAFELWGDAEVKGQPATGNAGLSP